MPRNTPKQTKKFITKHLKDTIDRRKQFAKIKQRHQLKEKRKARKALDAKPTDTDQSNDDGRSEPSKGASSVPNIKDMSMDDFFQGGFAAFQSEHVPDKIKKDKSAPESKLGKRKRQTGSSKEQDLESSSSSAEDLAFAEGSEDDASGDESILNDDQVLAHKHELDALAEKDPEFYNYLKENDEELLDFTAEDEALQLSDDEDERPRKRGKADSDSEGEEDRNVLSVATVRKWVASMSQQHSQAAMREVILAFRAAAHNSDDSEKDFKYVVPDADTYHEILMAALKGVPEVLAHHMPVKELASGKVRVPTDSKKYRTLSPMLNSHAISITNLLENLTDTKAINLTISSLHSLIPYFLSFKKTLKSMVKAVIAIWADPSAAESTRVNAFLLIKRLAVISDSSLREAVLKSVYQSLIKSARSTTVHTLPSINLMKNSAVDLWGLDPGLGYMTGFTYIRQLAIHLRTSITQPSKENYRAIYNWQYVHSLDFWSRVLSRHCSPLETPTLKKSADSPFHPLIYPLVQVTLGALRLVPSPAYFPLRFHLTRSLLRISRTTKTYIPLAPSLLEILQSPEMKKPPKNSTLKPLDFEVAIRASESYLRTRIYQDGLAEQVSELMAEFFGIWAKNIAFPELVIPPIAVLKRWLKEVSPFSSSKRGDDRRKPGHKASKAQGNQNGKGNSHFSLLVQKLQANATFIEEHRRKVDFAVNNRQSVESFLRDTSFEETPLGAYVVTVRRQKEERARVLEESRKEDEARRQAEKEDRDNVRQEGLSGDEMSDVSEEDGEGFVSDDDDDNIIMNEDIERYEEFSSD